MEHAAVASSVIAVGDLERSINFYEVVFNCEVTVHEQGAALLLSPDGFQIYLIEKGHRAVHPSGGIGVQYLMWATDSPAELAYFEQALQARGCHTDTHVSGGVRFVVGRDPDGIRVVIAHPSPAQRPRTILNIHLYA